MFGYHDGDATATAWSRTIGVVSVGPTSSTCVIPKVVSTSRSAGASGHAASPASYARM